jgi:hypothetical protein
MSLHDCEKCWSNPCECGYEYRHWNPDGLEAYIIMLLNVLKEKDPERASKYEPKNNG